jgi:energy-coupling factor transporter ATP-binding protein EcfA2
MPELKASEAGLERIKQARNKKGWIVEDSRWLVAASKILEPDQDWQPENDPYAYGISVGTWKAFLYNTRKKGITSDVFKAFCQVLEIPWAEVIESQVPSVLPGASLLEGEIPWYEICSAVLEAQKQQSLTSHVMGAVGSRKVSDVYVPLGLVERKDKPRVDSEINPSQSVMPEKETTVPISHSDFFDGVLKHGKSPSKGRRIAVIGEPGAGKTTLLQTIADSIKTEGIPTIADSIKIEGIPIWVDLSEIKKDQTLSAYLENEWLVEWALPTIERSCPSMAVLPRHASEELKDALATQFKTGQVWLLLNGADEMAANLGNPLAWVAQQLKGWVSPARVVMTCRLNLWSVSGDRLPDFDVYRNLDFNDGEVQNFITKWFAEPDEQSSGKDLWGELQKSNDRIRGLVRNPLRLTLLCLSWKANGEKLPDTKAGLYRRFVEEYYKWKEDNPEFKLSLTDQEQLHEALGNLAKAALEQQDSRFRLRYEFIRQHLKPALLLEQAIKLGWLVPVGLPTLDEEHDRDEDVYTFWHPTFQEYFAALAIMQNQSYGKIVDHYMFDSQWEEIFILTAELLPSSDDFLDKMRLKVNTFLTENPKLRGLLEIVHETFPNAESVRKIEEFRDLSLEDAIEYRIICQALNFGFLVWLACYTYVIYTALQTYKLTKGCQTLEELLQNPMNFQSFSSIFNQVFLSQNHYFINWSSLAAAIELEIKEIPHYFVVKMAQLPTAERLRSILDLKSSEDGQIQVLRSQQKNLSRNSRISSLPSPKSPFDFPSDYLKMVHEFISENDRIEAGRKADIDRGELWAKRFHDFLVANEVCQQMSRYSEQDIAHLHDYFHALLRYLNCAKAIRTTNSTLSVQRNIQMLFDLPPDSSSVHASDFS